MHGITALLAPPHIQSSIPFSLKTLVTVTQPRGGSGSIPEEALLCPYNFLNFEIGFSATFDMAGDNGCIRIDSHGNAPASG